jgi:hypothetical protein
MMKTNPGPQVGYLNKHGMLERNEHFRNEDGGDEAVVCRVTTEL